MPSHCSNCRECQHLKIDKCQSYFSSPFSAFSTEASLCPFPCCLPILPCLSCLSPTPILPRSHDLLQPSWCPPTSPHMPLVTACTSPLTLSFPQSSLDDCIPQVYPVPLTYLLLPSLWPLDLPLPSFLSCIAIPCQKTSPCPLVFPLTSQSSGKTYFPNITQLSIRLSLFGAA